MTIPTGNGSRQPMFSFLTSAYQTEKYIRETIESVLAQTRSDWELIVVDNGLSDEMAGIIGEYLSDNRIRLVRQENAGMGGGVNAAAAVARGRYLCPLDSDDLLERDYCECIGDLLESAPTIDAVGADATQFGDAPPTVGYFASIGRKGIPDSRRPVSFEDMMDNGVPHYAGAFRRELWHAYGGFEPSADVEEDVALWLRLAATGRDIRTLPNKLVRHRMRADSLSHNPETLALFDRRLVDAFLLVGREYGLGEDELSKAGMVRRLRQQHALSAARRALLEGDFEGARAAARDAFLERRTLRSAAVLAMLHTSPGVLRAMHPAKIRLENTARRAIFAGAIRRRQATSVGRS